MSNKEPSEWSGWYLSKLIYREHIARYKSAFFLVILCMVVTAVSTALNAWLMQPVLDSIFFNKELTMLYIVPACVVLNAFVKGVARFYETSIVKLLGQRIVADIQMRFYSHLLYSDTKMLLEYPSGNLISRLTNDINAMKKGVSDVLTGVVQEFLTVIGLIGLMFYQSKILALLVACILPLALYPIVKLGQRTRKVSKNTQEELADFISRLDETFQNVSLVKSYCRELYEIRRAGRVMTKLLGLYKRAAYIEAAPTPIMEILSSISIACIVWYGGAEVIASRMTPGEFFSFIAALVMAYKPLKVLSNLNSSLQEGLASSKRLFALLEQKPMIVDNPSLGKLKLKNFDIQFSNVSFAYKAGSGILNQFNMEVAQGKTVALVGSSGAGKTTVLQLLQRLYDPDSGFIRIGGVNIAEVNPSELRSYIALVGQDVALFDETIIENIRYGKLNATVEEVQAAANAAAAHEFIAQLPHGYNTQIGQHGVKLSGGQKQRLAIARAMLKNAPILLLDEATSALDSISEKQVQDALECLKRGRTTIYIAHRLSSVETADIICVLAEGKLLEVGNHQELLEKKGEYSKLYNGHFRQP